MFRTTLSPQSPQVLRTSPSVDYEHVLSKGKLSHHCVRSAAAGFHGSSSSVPISCPQIKRHHYYKPRNNHNHAYTFLYTWVTNEKYGFPKWSANPSFFYFHSFTGVYNWHVINCTNTRDQWDFPGDWVVKNLPRNAGDKGSIWLGN